MRVPKYCGVHLHLCVIFILDRGCFLPNYKVIHTDCSNVEKIRKTFTSSITPQKEISTVSIFQPLKSSTVSLITVIYMTFFVTTVFAAVIIHQAGKCHFLIVA